MAKAQRAVSMMSQRAQPVPCIPASAPFTAEQRAWLNGYLAGLFAYAEEARAAPTSSKAEAKSLLILFGSQTGTAEALAKSIGAEAQSHNWPARVWEMSRFAEVDWAKETHLLIVTSTWGDGDPPDNAAAFWSHLKSAPVSSLGHLNFAVLALGDRNYANFCGAGRKFDEQLEQLGARRIHPRADCDVDYEATAKSWLEGLWLALEPSGSSSDRAGSVSASSPRTDTDASSTLPRSSAYSRANPCPAPLLINRNLNGPGSAKETRHIEFSLRGSLLLYEPGDALGVLPCNCPQLVAEILAALGCDGEEAVRDPAQQETSLRNALLQHYQITSISQTVVEALALRTKDPVLTGLVGHKAELDKFAYGRDLLDILRAYPGAFDAPKELMTLLRPLQPRLYSISSSPKAHAEEVHITVGVVRYENHGRARKGVCSCFLADRLTTGATASVFIQTSPGFRLPAGPDLPIIMIGPGTGIAPFRAFLEERQMLGAQGKNWLFFGDQRQGPDFLYREQLQEMPHLTRLDAAFSRDQEEKVYVQHRMLENAQLFWEWLQEGAHVYVCGDAKRMARDVDTALHEIVVKAGGKTIDEAAEYVSSLKTHKRYQRDIY